MLWTYSPADKSCTFPRFPPNSPLLKTRFSLNGRRAWGRQRTRKQISGGFSSCLGLQKIYKQFWETRPGRLPTLNPKNGRSKLACLRPHREPGNRPCDITLLFLERVCVKLFKMSGGSTYLRVDGRKLQGGSQKSQDLLAGLYMYVYVYAYVYEYVYVYFIQKSEIL